MAWRSMIDEVMFEVQSMTGQVYKNVYAGKTADSEPITTAKVGHVQDQQAVSSS
jgi:hypothetical protein